MWNIENNWLDQDLSDNPEIFWELLDYSEDVGTYEELSRLKFELDNGLRWEWKKLEQLILRITWQEFDYKRFKDAIWFRESTSSYNKWIKLITQWTNIPYNRIPLWKYQFTVETLFDLWVDLLNERWDEIDKEKALFFLYNSELQDEILIKYSTKQINRAFKNKAYLKKFKNNLKIVLLALASWHIWWYWGLIRYMRWFDLSNRYWIEINNYSIDILSLYREGIPEKFKAAKK